MKGLFLPSRFGKQKIDLTKVRGFGRHIPCGGIAYWFTRFGKAWFDMNFSEVLFADSKGIPNGQIKFINKPIDSYNCSDCGGKLEGKDIRHVAIIQNDQAESLHREEHAKVKEGEICELCGKRKNNALDRRT